MKFPETCRTCCKSAKEDYLQNYLPIFICVYSFVKIIIVKILGSYSQETT